MWQLCHSRTYCRCSDIANAKTLETKSMHLFALHQAVSYHIIRKVTTDYPQPLREVYLDVLEICLSEPGHELDFLGHTMKMRQPAHQPTREDDWLSWPSWAPNWGQPVEFDPLPKKLYVPVGKSVPWIERVNRRLYNKINVYNASGGYPGNG